MPDARPDSGGLLPDLRALVGRPYLAELLDALSQRPMTARQLRVALPRSRRVIGGALRDLVVGRLVTGGTAGSWDEGVPADTRYRITERGRLAVRMLSSFSVWELLYANQGAVTKPAP